MEKNEVVTHPYNLRDRSTIRQTQVFGSRNDKTIEKKSLLTFPSFRNRNDKNGEQAEQSGPQANGQLSRKPKKSENKNKGNKKRSFHVTEPNKVVEQDKNDKSRKKIKKSESNKNDSNITPTEPQLNKEEERVNLDKDSDGKKPSNDISLQVEQVNGNINNITNNTEAVDKNEGPQVVGEYEKKCLKKINEIFEKARDFENRIDTFSDVEGSDAFYYIDENLQRNIEKLDRIDVMDSIILKDERKSAIKYIYNVIERLETKAKENKNSQLSEVM